jgi:hypothetical protein
VHAPGNTALLFRTSDRVNPISIILRRAFMPPGCSAIAVAGRYWSKIDMSDTAIKNAAGCCTPDPTELERLAASLAALALNYCKLHLRNSRRRVTRSAYVFPTFADLFNTAPMRDYRTLRHVIDILQNVSEK